MLFSSRPKDDIKNLFGRNEEIKKLKTAIDEKDPLVIITGFRRVGKTSLLKAVLNEYSKYTIYLDLRDLGSRQYITKNDIANLMESSIREFLDKHATRTARILTILQSVRGINVAGTGINLEWTSKNQLDLRGLFNKLDQWAGSNKTKIVLSVDEAQEFKKSQHVDMNRIFASIYDNCQNIILILTGSEIGVLHDFLSLDDPKSPLFGRNTNEIEIKLLSEDKGIEFLKKGFKNNHLKIKEKESEIINQAVTDLGGIIGWLNEFGLRCVRNKKIAAKFIEKTKKEGSILAKSEFEKFLANRSARDRYESIVKGLAKKDSNWKSLKDYLAIDTESKIYDKNFNDLLDNLLKSGFVAKKEELYYIVDPLLRFAYS